MKNIKPASERLAAAQTKQAALVKQIAATEAARHAALLADDDASAAVADRELIELRLAAKRAADQAELIKPLLEAERQQQDWPHDLQTARAKLEGMCRQHRALNAIRLHDRSASDQTQLDHLTAYVPAMQKYVAHLERMTK